MRRYLFAIVIVTITTSIMAQAQTWTSLNSTAGFKNVRDMSINHHGDTLYATDEVNLLNSKDSGKTWAATSSSVASPLAVTAKYDNNDIVLVSGSNFFKRSADGGNNWSEILSSTTNKPTALADFPQNSGVMLLGRKYYSTSERAIARSSNSGVDWTDRLSSGYKPRIFDIATNTSTAFPERAIAAGGPDGSVATGRGLFYTVDYGVFWTAKMTAAGNPAGLQLPSRTIMLELSSMMCGRGLTVGNCTKVLG